jgi:transcriptional regulator GlxA family with amidase domain
MPSKLTNEKTPASAHRSIQVGVLALDRALASAITAPLDAFRVANALYSREHPSSAAPIQLRIVHSNASASFDCIGELRIIDLAQAQGIRKDLDVDYLIVPGLGYRMPEDVLPSLRAMDETLQLLRDAHQRGTTLCASCSGTLLLAAAGLLDQQKATTSWWLAPIFQREFPHIDVDARAMLTVAKGVITAGASLAMFDLVLHIIEAHLGAAFASRCARLLLVDQQRTSQAPYVQDALLFKPRSSFADKIDTFLRTRLTDQNLNIDQIAEHCAMSTRSLIRHFQATFSKSPQAYVQQLRVERAKTLLTSSQLGLAEIVDQIGYADVASFRKLFRRLTDLTPAAYRQKFAAKPSLVAA